MPNDKYRPRVKVKRSSAGLGLFADEDIPRGQLIVEYTGERISSDEADRRDNLYLFTVRKDVVIDGSGRENTARYINHACKPNAAAEIEDKKRIYIRASRKIKKGEEVTYNYGKDYFENILQKKGCRCGDCLKNKKNKNRSR